LKAICKGAPDQRKYNKRHRSYGRQGAYLKTAEIEMVAIQIEVGQKNAHNTKIQKVLRTDDEFIWVFEISIHIRLIRHRKIKYKFYVPLLRIRNLSLQSFDLVLF
jgi:hypothetical protein